MCVYCYRFIMCIIFLLISWTAAVTPIGIVNLTLSYNETIQAAVENLKKVILNQSAIQQKYLPNLFYSGSYRYASEVSLIKLPNVAAVPMGVHDNFDNTLSATYLLYNGSGKEATLRSMTLAVKLAELSIEKTKKERVFQALSAYQTVQALRLQKNIVQSSGERAAFLYDKIKAQAETGFALKLDQYTAELSVLQFDQQLLDISATIEQAMDQLILLVGTTVTVDIPSRDYFAPRLPLAIIQPELVLMQIVQEDMLIAAKENAKSRTSPELFLNAQWKLGKPGLNSGDNAWMNYYIFGVNVNASLWDWNSTQAEVQSYDAELEAQQFKRQLLIKELALHYQAVNRDCFSLQQQLKVLQATLAVSKSRMQIYDEQLHNDHVSVADFHQANSELSQIESKVQQQKILILQKQLELDYLSGQSIDLWRIN